MTLHHYRDYSIPGNLKKLDFPDNPVQSGQLSKQLRK